jgi:hypothetical protein
MVESLAPRCYNEIRKRVVRSPLGGHALLTLVGRIRQIPIAACLSTVCTQNFRTYPQSAHRIWPPATACTHHVDAAPAEPPLRCRPMGQTPIYDQLRGEPINAEVPATGADPQRVDHPGKHHLADVPVAVAVFGAPGSGTDLGAHRHDLVRAYPMDQQACEGQWATAGWGPRAALPPRAHARHAPAHAASSSPAPCTASHHPAAQGAAPGGHGAHRRQGSRSRQVQRPEPRPAVAARAQFPWFDVDHDAGHSSSEEG